MNDSVSHFDARLQALQAAQAAKRVPLRWHRVQTLQARAGTLPPAVAQQLQPAVEKALTECEQAMSNLPVPSPATTRRPTAPIKPRRSTALAALTEQLRQHRERDARDAVLNGEAIDPTELTSLRRFRASWSRLAADQRLDAAMSRSPDNAGPLNSHALVLRTLALLRELSPDYLQRTLTHLESLMWLEDANQRPVRQTETKPARKGRGRTA